MPLAEERDSDTLPPSHQPRTFRGTDATHRLLFAVPRRVDCGGRLGQDRYFHIIP